MNAQFSLSVTLAVDPTRPSIVPEALDSLADQLRAAAQFLRSSMMRDVAGPPASETAIAPESAPLIAEDVAPLDAAPAETPPQTAETTNPDGTEMAAPEADLPANPPAALITGLTTVLREGEAVLTNSDQAILRFLARQKDYTSSEKIAAKLTQDKIAKSDDDAMYALRNLTKRLNGGVSAALKLRLSLSDPDINIPNLSDLLIAKRKLSGKPREYVMAPWLRPIILRTLGSGAGTGKAPR